MPDTEYDLANAVYSALSAAETGAFHRPDASAASSDAQESPLRTPEAFDTYCVQVQGRLAQYAQQRAQFLQNAYDRLTRLLHAARAVEDMALYRELWDHRTAVRDLQDTVRRNAASVSVPPPVSAAGTGGWPSASPPSRPTSLRAEADYAANGSAPSLSGPSPSPGYAGNGAPADSNAPRPPRRPARSLSELEADATRLREHLKDWLPDHPLTRDEGKLHVPNCLRLRALACRQRRLEEEAGDTEMAEVTQLAEDIVVLLDNANDEEYSVAFDYELEPGPTAYQWNELAERYEETAQAQEAFEWWMTRQSALAVSDIQPLAEAVGAVQQRFNRLLFRIGARDPFQQQLFDELRAWAREAQCYLQSLRPKVPIAELIDRASTLESSFVRLRNTAAAPDETEEAVV